MLFTPPTKSLMIHFDLQPILNGELLSLRPLQASDFQTLFKVAADPQIWDQHPFPRYELTAFKEFFDASIETKGALVILNKKTGEMVGTSRYYNLGENYVSIGYTFLARSHWGGVFNRELKKLMLSHAFQYVSKVFFDIGETNLRSRRAIEKIGARFIKLQTLKGKPYTLYEINREKFF